MRAGVRLGLAMAAALMPLGIAPASAQDAGQSTQNVPDTDVVGPKELQNFSLDGKVTRPSDQTATLPASRPSRNRPTTATAQPEPERTATVRADQPRPVHVPRESQSAGDRSRTIAPRTSSPAVTAAAPTTVVDPPNTVGAAAQPATGAAPGFSTEPQANTGTIAPEHGPSMLPWLLAALVLGAGAGFLFWRNRSRHAFAGGPRVDAFVPPQTAPAPPPAAPPTALVPAPPKSPPPSIPGLVSTRLRPWVEIGMHPLRCVVDDDRVTVEFELELFNSGSAPARAVLAEATLFNAGPEQERSVRAFFENPVGQGERIIAIPPLKRFHVKTQVTVGRDQVQPYEIEGRQVFVPVIAFNALYRWSSGEGQTSASYLLGRDTRGEKLAPFRLDLGPRIFRGLGARLLPTAVRQ